ncbi:MAG TPA: hypothetical protein VK663_11925 [Burkholderiales bacterium]|jgi:hypothetical protein|nr:hypothetical protein [Burkholderiales bacterium]
MKRHIIVLYISITVLLLAGRIAWQNCVWEIMSGVSSAAIVGAILIIGWRVIRLRPEAGDEITLRGEILATTRVAMVVICAGVLISGFGDVFGKWMFGCR